MAKEEKSQLYENCKLCPRNCGVNRRKGERGFCGEGDKPKVASAIIHYGEEPPFVENGGSGTVFFSGCTLQCEYCQNFQISHQNKGKVLNEEELSEIFLKLHDAGAQNINLVTATHFAPSVLTALEYSRSKGLTIPVLWNSSGYESISLLEYIDPFIEVYLPDLKTLDHSVSQKLYKSRNYPMYATEAIQWMVEHKPLTVIDKDILTGVVVRHLILPGLHEQTRNVMQWYSDTFVEEDGEKAFFSLMFQYIPTGNIKTHNLKRQLTRHEIQYTLDALQGLPMEQGFVQEFKPGHLYHDDWFPNFTKVKPFSSCKAQVVWSYLQEP